MFNLHLEKYNWSMLLYFEEISNELVVRKQRNIYLADHSRFFVYFYCYLTIANNFTQFIAVYCYSVCVCTPVCCRVEKQNKIFDLSNKISEK